MNQPHHDPQQPHYGHGGQQSYAPQGVADQTVRIPQYQPGPPSGSYPPPAAPPAPARKRRRWPWIVGGLVVLGIIGSAIGGNDEPAPAPVPAAGAVPAVDPPAPAALPAPAAPVAPAPAPVAAPPAPAEPETSVSQRNALESAERYLDFAGFSRTGLIKQLEFEEYSTADATFAVDNVTVDWMVEAEQSATNYMSFTSFSRSGLIDQLEFEGFTPDEAAHGADFVGL